MKNAFRAIALPLLIPSFALWWLFYFGPLLALGQIRFVRMARWDVMMFVVEDGGWFHEFWKGWAGFCGPATILMRSDYLNSMRKISHELRHADQRLIMSLFRFPFDLAYVLIFAVLFVLFGKGAYSKHPAECDACGHELA